jgi:hypothetical protein
MVKTLKQFEPEAGISDEQFHVLVDLLTPVHELAVKQLAMIAEHEARKEPDAPAPDPIETSKES